MKLTIFILEIVAFIFVSLKVYHTPHESSSQWFSEMHNFFRGSLMLLAVLLLIFIIRTILKSEHYFAYIFVGMIVFPIAYELYNYWLRSKEIQLAQNISLWESQTEIKYEKIWENIDMPEKALAQINEIDVLELDKEKAQHNIKLHKIALNLSLGLKDKNYYQTFLNQFQTLETDYERERVAYYTLAYKRPHSDEAIQKIIKTFENNPESILIVWRFFKFKKLVEEGFEESALLMLEKEKIEDKEGYLKTAKKISNALLRQKAINYIILQ